MRFPILSETSQYREMTTTFGGYNHRMSCQEGQFYDMKNMTSSYYPILSPRKPRGICKKFERLQALFDSSDLWWIDDGKLYKNGEMISLSDISFNSNPKTITKMGAILVVMPDMVWINTSNDEYKCGYMANTVTVDDTTTVSINICDPKGEVIEWKKMEDYESDPTLLVDGCYAKSVNSEGKPSLKVYSKVTNMWMTVASTYVQISAVGIGEGFEKGDGVKISIANFEDKGLDNIFVNKEEDGSILSTNTSIVDVDSNNIVIPGILKADITDYVETKLKIERKVPEIKFVTEHNNRLWACSKDGHEIYCCKLGDVKNWYSYAGIASDAWAGTIGSDGAFTGAITFGGYPIFFKENSMIRVSVSDVGAHRLNELACRGVQYGCDKSLTIINEVLYYKSATGVCSYDGSLPYSISDDLGETTYGEAVGGALGDLYYVSMRDNSGYCLFVYDTKKGIWSKEDNIEAHGFCKFGNDLLFVDEKDVLKSVGGSLPLGVPEEELEKDVEWYVESGPLGYLSPDNKYVSKIGIRITLEFGTNVDFFIQYDSVGEWEHKFNMSGSGTRTFTVPIIPKRCDHFRYKIVGRGACKIHSLTKTIEEGSDI